MEAVPVPARAMDELAPALELLLIVRVPVAAPTATGSNETVSISVCFGASVTGNELPDVKVNAEPVIDAELTVTAAVPDEVSVTVIVLFDVSVTLPKARLFVLTVSCAVVAATPVPVSVIAEVVPVVALLVMVILPVSFPAAVGEKVTGMLSDCP